jgi:Tol biopolymer transport system component
MERHGLGGRALGVAILIGLAGVGTSPAQPPGEPPPHSLWVLSLDANAGRAVGDPRVLALKADLGVRALSEDGRLLAVVSTRDGKTALWISDLTNGRETRLTTSEWPESAPVLSPDGRRVFYLSKEDEADFVCSAPTSGGSCEKECVNCGHPAGVSPDAGTLLLQEGSDGRATLAALDLRSGRTSEVLSDPTFALYRGHLSPDGRWVVFHAGEATPAGNKATQEFVAPFRGLTPIPRSEWVAITDGKAYSDVPLWSPDGNRLYYVSDRDGFRCIWSEKLEPKSKRPSGEPLAVIHLHGPKHLLKEVPAWGLDVSLAADKLIFGLGETGGEW